MNFHFSTEDDIIAREDIRKLKEKRKIPQWQEHRCTDCRCKFCNKTFTKEKEIN